MLLIYLSMIEDEDTRVHFERIYRKYYDGVYRRIYKIVKNKQDAEDVSQETWLKAVKHFDRLKGKRETTVIAYIMRIARNESISLLRSRNKVTEMQTDDDLSEVADENDFFCKLESHSEDYIVDCIKSLDAIYSDVLVYYYLYHYSVDAIAELLEISEDATRKRISRGRAQLAVLLNKEGIL